jgi:hypothetical protein
MIVASERSSRAKGFVWWAFQFRPINTIPRDHVSADLITRAPMTAEQVAHPQLRLRGGPRRARASRRSREYPLARWLYSSRRSAVFQVFFLLQGSAGVRVENREVAVPGRLTQHRVHIVTRTLAMLLLLYFSPPSPKRDVLRCPLPRFNSPLPKSRQMLLKVRFNQTRQQYAARVMAGSRGAIMAK